VPEHSNSTTSKLCMSPDLKFVQYYTLLNMLTTKTTTTTNNSSSCRLFQERNSIGWFTHSATHQWPTDPRGSDTRSDKI